MAFVDIPTLGAGTVHVAAGAVDRVMRSLEDGVPLTRVEFGGAFQLTREPVADVAAALTKGGAKLVALTGPDGGAVFLAFDSITGMRAADPQADPAPAGAVVFFSGGRQVVRESVAEVQALLGA